MAAEFGEVRNRVMVKRRATSLLELIKSKDYAYLVTIDKDNEVRSVFKSDVEDIAEDCLPPTESYFDADLCPTEQEKLLESPGDYSINLDGNWFLGDLVEIPRVYNQLYSFIYTLRHLYKSSVESNASEIFSRYPWRGGFSAVHFYCQLNRVIPSLHEPKIREISYASPGEIRLELHVDASIGVRNSINSVSKNFNRLAELSKEIRALVCDEGLSKIEGNVSHLRLSQQARKFLKVKVVEIGKEMGL